MADGTTANCRANAMDLIFAAIADAYGCVEVTANERDFDGVGVVNLSKPSSS